MKVIIIDENMILSSKLRNQARNKGFEAKVISFTKPDTIEKIKEFNPDYIFINLESRVNNPLQLCKDLKENGFKIIGYCGHTKVDLARSAKEVGVDFVATNSSVISHFDEILNGV